MKLGYNTNGLAHHHWRQGIELLSEFGYRSVALTIDHNCLDPFSSDLGQQVHEMKALLERLDMTSVIETGARYLLNPRVKHEPTLMSGTAAEQNVRIDFLKRAVDIAAELGSEAVSFWSGILREPLGRQTALDRLVGGCEDVTEHAAKREINLAFEPEPGMFIETMEQYQQLLDRIDAPHFGLTLDIGHLHCVESAPIPQHLRRWSRWLFNVHIEDMCQSVHEHLRFGAGEIDFPPVLSTLVEIGYTGSVNVELSRHSHMAPEVVRESMDFLSNLLRECGADAHTRRSVVDPGAAES